jgi:hypothetical protein
MKGEKETREGMTLDVGLIGKLQVAIIASEVHPLWIWRPTGRSQERDDV